MSIFTPPQSRDNRRSLLCLIAGILLLTLISQTARAQQLTVTPDRTRVAVGEQIQVTVRIVSPRQLGRVAAPQLPPSEFYTVVRTSQDQSQNTSIVMSNGRLEQKSEITYLIYYQLATQKEGEFTFPALQVPVDGGMLTSPPFSVTVSKEAVQNPEVTARLSISKSDLYVGEQAILSLQVSVKAQSAAQLTQQGFSTYLEALNNAIKKDFSITHLFKEVTGTQERVGGEIYRVYRARFALFSLSPGATRIPPIGMEYVVQKRVQASRRGDPFDDFFGGGFFGASVQNVPQTAVTNALSINVKSLPPAPAGFSGAVGAGFSLVAAVDPTTVASGDAVTLKIGLRGATRPVSLGEITLPQLDAFEAFTPEKSTAVDTSDNGLVSRLASKYLLIAQQEGTARIPPVRWTYFDTQTGAYKTLLSDSLAVEVTKGKAVKKDGARYLSQAEIREVGKDIRYIKTGTKIRNQPTEPYKNPLFYVLYPLPFLCALFALLYRIQSRRQRDVAKVLRSKALARARKELAETRKALGSRSADQILGAVAGVIERFISHKFAFPASGRTLDELQQELARRGVDQRIVADLAAFVETMDRYRFGGATLDESSKNGMLDKTEAFVDQLERASRKEAKK